MPNPIIPPTVGRVLWFYPSEHTGEAGFVRHSGGGGPYAAIIAHVWSDSVLNLTVFDANGTPHSRTSVPLIQDGDAAPDHAFCGWMPFQKGQAIKQESEANQQTAQIYVPRTFRQALDALLEKDGGTALLIGLPVRDDHRNEDVVHASPLQFGFGRALSHLKDGRRVARAGWNGKGMWLYLNLGSHDKTEQRPLIDGVSRSLFTLGDDGTVTRLPNVNMRAASGVTVTGWLASQTDMLAEDWMLVE